MSIAHCLFALAGPTSALLAQEPESTAPPTDPDALRVEVGLVVLGAMGGSTADGDRIRALQGGGHDPRRNGFTLQQIELALAGGIESWGRAQVRLVGFLDPEDGETEVELEDAYVATTRQPGALELQAGLFATAFGIVNRQHPHEWDWQDQPLMLTRALGPDGMRAPGLQLSWAPDDQAGPQLFWSAQNADGEPMASFLANAEFYDERPLGGRFFTEVGTRSVADLVYAARAEWRLGGSSADLLLGASVAIGPNATGPGQDTLLYGIDTRWRLFEDEHAPHGEAGAEVHEFAHGTETGARLVVQAELVGRRFDAGAQVDDRSGSPVVLPADRLLDLGGYLQGLYAFRPGWAAGLRVEYATGAGASYDPASQTFARAADPFRADRLRLSPLLVFRPSAATRLRLQYDYDDVDTLADPQHSVWFGFEVHLGAHRPHAH